MFPRPLLKKSANSARPRAHRSSCRRVYGSPAAGGFLYAELLETRVLLSAVPAGPGDLREFHVPSPRDEPAASDRQTAATLAPAANDAAVSGTKYNDMNGNGVRDAGEPGLGGFVIYTD